VIGRSNNFTSVRAPCSSAFTLLELIVAMFMVSIMAAALFASMRIAFRSRSSAEVAIEPARTASVAMEFLREDLQNAVPPPPTSSSSTGTATGATAGTTTSDSTATVTTLAQDFVGIEGGDYDDLVFYTTASGPKHTYGDGEIKRVELVVLTPDGSNDRVLVRRVVSNLLAPSAVALNPDDEVLCRGVAGFNLRYFDGSTWQDNWDSTQQSSELPVAVEATLALQRPDPAGMMRTLRYVRVFPLSCSALLTDQIQQNLQQSGTGTGAGSGTTGGTTP
jgi:type II secretory pathway pseudopilin PulG